MQVIGSHSFLVRVVPGAGNQKFQDPIFRGVNYQIQFNNKGVYPESSKQLNLDSYWEIYVSCNLEPETYLHGRIISELNFHCEVFIDDISIKDYCPKQKCHDIKKHNDPLYFEKQEDTSIWFIKDFILREDDFIQLEIKRHLVTNLMFLP